MKKIITFIIIAAVIVFGIFYGLSWIPKSVDFKVTGKINQAEPYDETLTVKGEIYTPWFSRGMFKGTVSFENSRNGSLSAEFDGKNTSVTSEKNRYCFSGGIGMKIIGGSGASADYTSTPGDRHEIVMIDIPLDDSRSVFATWHTDCHKPEFQMTYYFST